MSWGRNKEHKPWWFTLLQFLLENTSHKPNTCTLDKTELTKCYKENTYKHEKG